MEAIMPASFTAKKMMSLFTAIGLLLSTSIASAIPRYNLHTSLSKQTIGNYFEYLVDDDKQYDAESIQSTPSIQWRSIRQPNPSFGFSTHPHWFRSEIYNSTDQALNW